MILQVLNILNNGSYVIYFPTSKMSQFYSQTISPCTFKTFWTTANKKKYSFPWIFPYLFHLKKKKNNTFENLYFPSGKFLLENFYLPGGCIPKTKIVNSVWKQVISLFPSQNTGLTLLGVGREGKHKTDNPTSSGP